MSESYATQWHEFRRRNRAAILWLALGFPALVPIAILLQWLLSTAGVVIFIALAILWVVGFAWFGFRFAALRCPRCGNKFFAHQGIELGATRCCSNCNLKLYAEP